MQSNGIWGVARFNIDSGDFEVVLVKLAKRKPLPLERAEPAEVEVYSLVCVFWFVCVCIFVRGAKTTWASY